MNIVHKSEELSVWLHNKIDGLAVSNDERSRVSACCFDVVLEHQQAVTILTKHKLYGSAFALARSAYEAYVRGVWLNHCASEKQIQEFLLNDKLKGRCFSDLILDIEKVEGYAGGVLSKAKDAGWGLLNSFTHTGFNQLVRRNTEQYIEPNYENEDICQIIDLVNSNALLAGLEITFLAGDIERSGEFLEKMKEYVSKSAN